MDLPLVRSVVDHCSAQDLAVDQFRRIVIRIGNQTNEEFAHLARYCQVLSDNGIELIPPLGNQWRIQSNQIMSVVAFLTWTESNYSAPSKASSVPFARLARMASAICRTLSVGTQVGATSTCWIRSRCGEHVRHAGG
jgi:hypothetical protein